MKRIPGTWLVLMAALLWSTGGVAIKYVPVDGASLACARGLIAGLVFLPFSRPGRVTVSWKLLGLLVSYSLMNVTFVTATKWTAAGNAVALQYTAPLWIFGVQVALRLIKLTPARALPIGLGAVGIVLFLLEPSTGSSFQGNLMGLFSGVWYALTLAFFRALRDDHSASLVCLSNLCAGVVILPFIGGLGWLMDLPLAGQACMFYLGAVQIGAAYFFYSKGVRRVAVLRASTIALAEPVLNPAWVFLILGERLSWHAIAGGAAILVGVALDLWLNREVDGASE